MAFRKFKGIRLPYTKQGLIYFTCMDFADRPKREREKIKRLCDEIGGSDYSRALFVLLTKDSRAWKVAQDMNMSESNLCRLRRKFFEAW